MKKLITMLVVVGAAVYAQAATVKWVVSNVYTPTTELLAPGSTGGGAKMTVAEAANLLISVYWDANQGAGEADWSLISDTATLTGSGIKASADLWSQDTAVANRNGDGDAYFKVVLTYTTATHEYSVEKESGAIDLSNITAQGKTATFNMNNATWTAVAVPEPTSGLLMLVGLAGLALRRRRS